VRRWATCLKWEVGALTSDKAQGPLNNKGLSLYLAYLYMQLLVTLGLHLITKLRKRMRHRLLDWSDKLLLHIRATAQTIND